MQQDIISPISLLSSSATITSISSMPDNVKENTLFLIELFNRLNELDLQRMDGAIWSDKCVSVFNESYNLMEVIKKVLPIVKNPSILNDLTAYPKATLVVSKLDQLCAKINDMLKEDENFGKLREKLADLKNFFETPQGVSNPSKRKKKRRRKKTKDRQPVRKASSDSQLAMEASINTTKKLSELEEILNHSASPGANALLNDIKTLNQRISDLTNSMSRLQLLEERAEKEGKIIDEKKSG